MAENNASNPIKDLIMGMGALGEMAALMRDSLIKNGFTREEACMMVSNYINELTIKQNKK